MYEARQRKEKVSRRIAFKPTATAILQRIRYEAGIGNDWHVHKDHVKYDGSNSSRVNFNRRPSNTIINELNWKIQRFGLQNTIKNNKNYDDCIQWIKDNY